MDTDNSGFIELGELEVSLKNAKCNVDSASLKHIMQELDYSGNQKINYTEFLAATISIQNILTHSKLEALFR